MSKVPQIMRGLFLALLLLAGCAPVNVQEYTSLDGKCRVNAVDIRTGSNVVVRALSAPHRFIDKNGQCDLAVEDSNSSLVPSLLGPAGDVVKPVLPIR